MYLRDVLVNGYNLAGVFATLAMALCGIGFCAAGIYHFVRER